MPGSPGSAVAADFADAFFFCGMVSHSFALKKQIGGHRLFDLAQMLAEALLKIGGGSDFTHIETDALTVAVQHECSGIATLAGIGKEDAQRDAGIERAPAAADLGDFCGNDSGRGMHIHIGPLGDKFLAVESICGAGPVGFGNLYQDGVNAFRSQVQQRTVSSGHGDSAADGGGVADNVLGGDNSRLAPESWPTGTGPAGGGAHRRVNRGSMESPGRRAPDDGKALVIDCDPCELMPVGSVQRRTDISNDTEAVFFAFRVKEPIAGGAEAGDLCGVTTGFKGILDGDGPEDGADLDFREIFKQCRVLFKSKAG